MLRSYVMPDMDSAESFIADLNRQAASGGWSRRQSAVFFPVSTVEGIAGAYGGRAYYSARGKEVQGYDYQPFIYQVDRNYLYHRDPTARMICRDVPRDCWFMPPRTYDDTFDPFFASMWQMGFGRAALGADASHRRDGGSFIFINASGSSPAEPLRSDSRIFGFDYINREAVVPESVVRADMSAPLLAHHGIHSLEVEIPNERQPVATKKMEIHGSRLINLNENFDSRWWYSEGVLDPIFDALWNLRDIEYGVKQRQAEGNPIVVDVDTENYEVDQEQADVIASEVSEFRGLGRDSFSPVEGLTLRRLGAPEMDVPDWAIRMAVSRISNSTEFTPNHILSSTRGSDTMTQADFASYYEAIRQRQATFVLPILRHLADVGKHLGLINKRPVLPLDVEWPDPRTYNARERAYIDKSDVTTLKTALQAGRLPPRRILAKFPEFPGNFADLEKLLPSVAAKRGGSSAPPPGGSSPSDPSLPTGELELEGLVRSIVAEMKEEDEMEEFGGR